MQPQGRTPPIILRMIWFALVISTVIYAVIVYMISASHPHAPFGDAVRSQMTLILYGLCVASFFAGNVAWSVMRNRPLQLRMVVSMAIFESGAVYGLIAAFLAYDWRLYLGPWLVALIGFARCFPSDAASAESHMASPYGSQPLG
jgi:F0F1-type ATP synthase membrane subunit c/vacuolar-type H+-ATPase subunit K